MCMTKEEVIAEMQSNSILNKVRQIISSTSARLEQVSAQRCDIFELRNIEFEAAKKIIGLARNF